MSDRLNMMASNVWERAWKDIEIISEGLGMDAVQRATLALKVCQGLFVKAMFQEVPVSMWQAFVHKWQGPMAEGIAKDLERLRVELKGAQDGAERSVSGE